MKSFKNIAILLSTFLLISFKASAQQDSATQREELAPFVLPGYDVLNYAYGDLNKDKLEDVMLVLKKQDEPLEPDMYEPADSILKKRPLLILIRKKDGFLKEVARNDNIVLCAKCGGIYGDPFDGIEISKNTFTVGHYGGSAWRWRADFTFQFDFKSQKWYLVKESRLSYHTSNPRKIERKVKTKNQLGKITFEEFDNYKDLF